jgi:transposase
MFVRVSTVKGKSKTYRSVQIAESFRDPEKGPRTRIVAHLGQIEGNEEQLQKIISGLNRILGKPTAKDVIFEQAKDFGHTYLLDRIWKKLKLSQAVQELLKNSDIAFDLESYLKLMVLNRLCDPSSKLGILEWIKGVYFPSLDEPEYHKILRTMDWLIENKTRLEPAIWNRMKTMLDIEADLVLYDVTSSYFEGERSLTEEDIRCSGHSRDKRPDRKQVVIGLVVTRSGLPICHHVFPGNTTDSSTLGRVVKDLKERFRIKRVIFVGDRGMISRENIAAIKELGLDYILAHSPRSCSDSHPFLRESHRELQASKATSYAEKRFSGFRYVVRFDPDRAEEIKNDRETKIAKADAFIHGVKKSLKNPRSSLTVKDAYAKIKNYLQLRGLIRFYFLDIDGNQDLVCRSQSYARSKEKLFDGKLILETSDMALSPEEIDAAYRSLQEVERDFRYLKGPLKLRPNHHWTEKRIKAHIFVCVMALQLERYLDVRLSGLKVSVSKIIESLRRIKIGQLEVQGERRTMLTQLEQEHKTVFKQLQLPLPKAAPEEM